MNTSKYAGLGFVLLASVTGCGPQLAVRGPISQPYPANVLVQDHQAREVYRRPLYPYPAKSIYREPVIREPVVVRPEGQRIVQRRPEPVVVRAPVEVLDAKYDKASEMTIRDVVLGKRYVKLPEGDTGVVVRLQPGGDFVEALVGTTQYLSDHAIDIGIADPLTVSGSMLQVDGTPMLLAKEIIWRGSTLQLRNAEGEPLWHGHYNLAEVR